MIRHQLAALIVLLILASTAMALPCNPFTVPGSYYRQGAAGYMDQLTLSIDGTAYWYQSSAFDFFVTAGSFIPQVGSWTCLLDGSVLVTTVGSDFLPNGGGDLRIANNNRFTQKLTVVNSDTLLPTHRTSTITPLANDPLGPGTSTSCRPTATPCGPSVYKRIKPVAADIQ